MKSAFNIKLLDVEEFIKKRNVKEVTSSFIRTPSSNELDPNGIFSQEIFGQIASEERMLLFGFINLKVKIFHPKVFKSIATLKSYYTDIMAGNVFAIFDEQLGDFIKTTSDDPNSNTGYNFFMSNFDKIKFKETDSLTRKDKLETINKFKTERIMEKYLVSVAGIRDIHISSTKDSYDEINKLYINLLTLCRAIPDYGHDNEIYDNLKYAIQKKAIEIYDYIGNIMQGKTSWLEDKFLKRTVTLGARNVISASHIQGMSPKDPRVLKHNECMIGVYHAAKILQPIFMFYLKKIFFNQIINPNVTQISVIDPKTLKITYKEIDSKIKNQFITEEGLENIINRFEYDNFRKQPVSIKDINGIENYLFLIYDIGDKIQILRDINLLGNDYDKSKLRPLTYLEMFYIAANHACSGRHGINCRYPVANDDSIKTPKLHLISTQPDRHVKLVNMFQDIEDEDIKFNELYHFPILNNSCVDTLIVHPFSLATYGGDYDGDMLNAFAALSKESNKEIDDYHNSIRSVIKSNGEFRVKFDDLTYIGIYSLTRSLLSSEKK